MTRLGLVMLALAAAVLPALVFATSAGFAAAPGEIVAPGQVVAPPGEFAAPPSDFLVVPGHSMGPVAIGMRLEAVEQIFGSPSKVDPTGTTHWYEWKSPVSHRSSIAVETLQNTVVLISLAHDPRYRTSQGLGDGTAFSEVRRVLGRPSSTIRLGGFSIIQYRLLGIGFVTDGTGHVTGIIVAPKV